MALSVTFYEQSLVDAMRIDMDVQVSSSSAFLTVPTATFQVSNSSAFLAVPTVTSLQSSVRKGIRDLVF